MDKMADLIGKKINKLYVESFYRREKNGRTRVYYMCSCECGNKISVLRDGLIKGTTKSCGCYRKNLKAKNIHGMTETRIYSIWANMKNRVLNTKGQDYKYYGGKGIKICDHWLKFINFKDDMLESYLEHVKKHGEKNTTLDRKNGDGDYNFQNCRWATMHKQNNNKKLNRKPFKAINLQTGEEHIGLSMAEMGRRLGIRDCNIKNILEGRRKQTYGYTFKYIE